MAVTSIANKLKSGSLLAGNSYYIPPSYESIATVTVGAGGSSTITFSSIPSTYKHLQIRTIGKASNSGGRVDVTFNSDTGANYANHYLDGTGSAVNAGADTSGSNMKMYYLNATNASANVFSGGVIDILDYANTNKYKTVRSLIGYDQNGSGDMTLQSGLWQSTSAISSITFTGQYSFVQYSSFALYGVK